METPNPSSPAQSQPFTKWIEFKKTIKGLPVTPSESDRQAMDVRWSNSPQRQLIAFEFLYWRKSEQTSTKYQWLDSIAIRLLSNGEPALNISIVTSPGKASDWVLNELRDIKTESELKNYHNSGRHLWLLHNILGLTSNKTALVEAISALVECMNHLQSNSITGKHKKTNLSPTEAQWIARLIKSQIHAKPELSTHLLETLFAITATAELSEEVRAENERLRLQLQQTSENLTYERQAKENADAHAKQFQSELTALKQDLANAVSTLEEERKHTLRTHGFSSVSRRETVIQVLAAVRQGMSHRLESIRQFTDRENPNKDEILDLVNEVEKHLAVVERSLIQ